MSEIRNITIYDRNGNVRATVPATDNCERVHSLMSDNYVQVSFNDENYRAFAAGDNIQYNGEKFWLLDDYFPENKGGYFNYSMRFSAIEEHFARPIFFREVEITNNATQVTEHWREPEFSLNANLLTIAKEVIKSLNANGAAFFGAVFVLPDLEQGEYETELKALSFSGVSISEAICYIAETFETEWWLEPQPNNTYILHFDKCEHGDFVELSDGYENVDGKWTCGVYDGDIMGGVKNVKISGSRENVVQRVFAYGSERNITRKVAQTGQAGGEMNVSYAKRLRLNPTLYPNGYIEVPNVTNGTEEVKFFEDIYPRRIGTISEVRRKVRTADEIFFVSDSELPTVEWDETAQRIFPKDFVIEGCTMMMRFVSGYLNGFEFEVNWKSETNEFEIINQEEDGQQIPMGAFVPRVGDQYVLWNMKMPQMYVDLAQQELAEKTQEYIAELQTSTPEVSFDSEPTSFAARGISLKVGSRVQLASVTAYRGNCIIQSRIVSYNYNLTTPEQISFKMASGRTTGRLAAIENAISQQVATIDGIRQTMRSVSPRAWRDAQEMSQMLDSLQKEMVLVGVEENTFTLTSGISIEHVDSTITLRVTKGRLVHNAYGEWTIPQYVPNITSSATDSAFYLYAACSKTSNTIATMALQATKRDFETSTHYNFLLGIVSSLFEGRRVFNPTSGFTQIAGGTLTTQTIQDAARNLIIDFASTPPRIIARNGAEIRGNIKFLSGQSVESAIIDVSDEIVSVDSHLSNVEETAQDAQSSAAAAASAAATAQSTANTANTKATNAQTSANNANTKIDNQKTITENLVLNGNGILLNNTNFNPLTFSNEKHDKGFGSYRNNTTTERTFTCQELIPINTSRKYEIQFTAKQQNSAHVHYSFFDCLDIDKKQILAYHTIYMSGTLTTLAQELKNGDTQIRLTSAAGWKDTTATYQRGIIAWNYRNSAGYQYPAETYSRNVFGNIYAGNSSVNKSTGVITLKAAWNSGTIPAGTQVSQCSSGSTYCYFGLVGVAAPQAWAIYKTTVTGESHYGNSTTFRAGTAYIRFGCILNNNNSATACNTYIANVSIKDVTDFNELSSRITTVQTQANGLMYLKQALAGSAEIQGGLVLGNILAVKNQSGAVQAGINGIQGSTADVRFWAGATVQNMAAAIFRVLSDGTGKWGVFQVDSDAVRVIGSDPNSQNIIITNKRLSEVANVAHTLGVVPTHYPLSRYFSYSNMHYSHNTADYVILTKTVNVSQSTTYIINTEFEVDYEAGVYIAQNVEADASAIVRASGITFRIRQGNNIIFQKNKIDEIDLDLFADTYDEQNEDSNYNILNINQNVYIPAGNTVFELIVNNLNVQCDTNSPVGEASIYANFYVYCNIYDSPLHLVSVERDAVFSNDGIALRENSEKYFKYSPAGLECKGATNLPGVLLSGLINGGGFISTYWGAKVPTGTKVSRTSTGVYVVYHTIGHSNYRVQATIYSDTFSGVISTYNYTANSFTVRIRNLSSVLANCSFCFTVIGSN